MSDTPTGSELALKSAPTIGEVIDHLRAENTSLREQLRLAQEQLEEARARELPFPEHKCGLYLTHNEHLDLYQTVEQFTEDSDGWVSTEEKKKAIATNELWQLQWYPDTPVGFYVLKASSLEAIHRELAAPPTKVEGSS